MRSQNFDYNAALNIEFYPLNNLKLTTAVICHMSRHSGVLLKLHSYHISLK